VTGVRAWAAEVLGWLQHDVIRSDSAMRDPILWHGVVIALALAFVGVACKSAPYVWVNNYPIEPVGDGGGGPVTISAGDLIEVRVFGQEAMSTKGEVRSDGTLALPLLGQVAVAGRRPEEIASSLKERLKPFIVSPEVTVVIQESRVLVSMVGEVKGVGVVQLRPPATVLQALAMAGGLSDFADRSGIYVLRTVSGVTTRIRFRYDLLIEADPIATRFRLKTGDVIVVE
jgi:polysaccharide biosynthesis/export protein